METNNENPGTANDKLPTVIVESNEGTVITTPAWLRARAENGGSTLTRPADTAAVYEDDMRRFRDPDKTKHRVRVRLTVRAGQGAMLVPGGHLVYGGVNTPIAMWPEELDALRTHYLATPEDEAKLEAARRAYEFEIARETRKKLIARDQTWNQATTKEIEKIIADDSGDVGFKLLVKNVRETSSHSVQSCYYATTEESSRPVIAIEVLEESMSAPSYAPEVQRQAAADAMAEGIQRALAPSLDRLAAGAPTKGGK